MCFLPLIASFGAPALQPLGRKGNLLEGAGRQMHMSLAGVLSPGRMQSFKLESHWVFERTNVGSGKEVFSRAHISPGLL